MSMTRNTQLEVKAYCPHCREEVTINIEVESPSDYFCDESCPECGNETRGDRNDIVMLDESIYNAVVNYYAGLADSRAER